jgi:hypothetical protein
MATQAQLIRQKLRSRWTTSALTTAKRDTEYNDLAYNDFPWKHNETYMSLRWMKARKDIIL